MYRHFIWYLNITGHDMTHLIFAYLHNHSKNHSRNTMPNRPKTIPYLRFETLKTIPYWAETIYQSSRWIYGPLSPLHVSLYIHVYCIGSENMLLPKKSGGKFLILQKTCSEINYEDTWQSEWEEMVYFKCIGKGSALTLEEAITIAKNVT